MPAFELDPVISATCPLGPCLASLRGRQGPASPSGGAGRTHRKMRSCAFPFGEALLVRLRSFVDPNRLRTARENGRRSGLGRLGEGAVSAAPGPARAFGSASGHSFGSRIVPRGIMRRHYPSGECLVWLQGRPRVPFAAISLGHGTQTFGKASFGLALRRRNDRSHLSSGRYIAGPFPSAGKPLCWPRSALWKESGRKPPRRSPVDGTAR